MRTYLDCYPCFLRQALEAARLAGADESQQKAMLDRVFDVLKQIGSSSTPPEIGDLVHRIVRQEVGDSDPYQAAKEQGSRGAEEQGSTSAPRPLRTSAPPHLGTSGCAAEHRWQHH